MGLNYRYLRNTGALQQQAADGPAETLFAPPHVVELIPASVARENVIFPLHLDGETLTVAAARADDLLLRDKLSFILNKRIRFVAYPRTAIEDAIHRHYSGTMDVDSMDCMLAEFVEPPAKAKRGRLLGRVASSVTATKKSLALGDGAALSASGPSDHHSRAPKFDWPATGEDPTPPTREGGMFYHTVEQGQRVLVTHRDGSVTVVEGPARFWKGGKTVARMAHYVAHPGEFLIVRFRDGRQEHHPGPAELWFDPRVHLTVTKEESLQLASKEAVVVYSRGEGTDPLRRRLVHGPALFVPAPGEWLHTFAWHGSEGGSQGIAKVAKGLVFQKLWLMPDQMYHNVEEVRTADDAVLTIKLMIFFELADIEKMLEATHDPIGDFVNAATSDVVEFTGRRTFEQFKKDTGGLNELEAYRQLLARAAQTGYRITKVVYRGYAAPERLQAMHDQAIEARTKLELDRETEQQAQELEDYRLSAQLQRAAKRRTEQATEVDAEVELARKRQAAEREQTKQLAEVRHDIRKTAEERLRQHLAGLKYMGVDLTAYLTQGRADQVFEVRGTDGTHLHLPGKPDVTQ